MGASESRTLQPYVQQLPETSPPKNDIPNHLATELDDIKKVVEHVESCSNFPCETCVREMTVVKVISGNSALDQAAIGDLMARRTNFAPMFVNSWDKQHVLELCTNCSEQLTSRGLRSFEFYRALAGTAWNYADESDAFCEAMHEKGCLMSLGNWMIYDVAPEDMNKWTTEIAFNVLNIFHNVCRRQHDIARNYRDVVPALVNMGRLEDVIIQCCAFMTLSYLVKKDEADKLSVNDSCVDTLLSLLSQSVQLPDRKIRINRPTTTDAFRRGFTLSASELVQAVEQLAINDGNKRLIAEKGGIPLFGRMLEVDCPVKERTHAAEALWALAFLEENKQAIRKEQDIIKELIRLTKSDDPTLRVASMGALFEIYDSRLPDEVMKSEHGTSTATFSSKKKPPSHIMVSYKWESPSKEVMREIKDQLKAKGFNVWMDEEFMSGDMLDAMTSAVENAYVILACISEGYQESKNCRTEAKYAYDCNKKIIPIKVSDNIRATGWLGGLTAGKIYYVIKGVPEVHRELPRIIDLEIKGFCPRETDESAEHTKPPSIVESLTRFVTRDWRRTLGIAVLSIYVIYCCMK